MIPAGLVVADISDNAMRLYLVLTAMGDYNTRLSFPSKDTLANILGVTTSAVSRAIRELVKKGWIEKFMRAAEDGKTQESNVYKTLIPAGINEEFLATVQTATDRFLQQNAKTDSKTKSKTGIRIKPPSKGYQENIRPERGAYPEFIQIPTGVFFCEIKATALRVYIFLTGVSYWGLGREMKISYGFMQEALSYEKQQTINNAIKSLESLCLLERKRQYDSVTGASIGNAYLISQPENNLMKDIFRILQEKGVYKANHKHASQSHHKAIKELN